eukprot:4080955-Pyramimonas_sp.AAC.1
MACLIAPVTGVSSGVWYPGLIHIGPACGHTVCCEADGHGWWIHGHGVDSWARVVDSWSRGVDSWSRGMDSWSRVADSWSRG